MKACIFSSSSFAENTYFGRTCRFRMRPHVFLRLVQAVDNVDPYFHFKYDAAGRAGLSPLQKCVAAIHILAYDVPTTAAAEYVRIGESTARETLNHFCAGNSTSGLPIGKTLLQSLPSVSNVGGLGCYVVFIACIGFGGIARRL
jgi:hypothetical protein